MAANEEKNKGGTLYSGRYLEEQEMSPKELKKHRKEEKKEAKRVKEANKTTFQVAMEYVRVILIGALVAFLLCKFVIVNAEVPSGSMIPTINIKDRMIGLRMTYYFTDPKRGDVAIFKCPAEGPDYGKLYVKRVIGLPGETVTIKAGQVIITTADGETIYLDESYLNETPREDLTVNNQTYILGDDEYFMMGDNRDYSYDSRFWGSVPYRLIVGKPWFVYFSWDKDKNVRWERIGRFVDTL